MKCPRCAEKHKRKAGMVCRCGNRFVFDPKARFGFNDMRFGRVLRRASAGGTRHFTKGQLEATFLTEYHSGLSRTWAGAVLAMVVFGGALGFIGRELVGTPWMFVIAPALVVAVTVRHTRRARRLRPTGDELDAWVHAWTASYGRIDRLLTEPSLIEPPGESDVKDLFDYGVEHVLIVDDDLMVDFLVLNGWAAQHHCLVLSERGYPTHIADLARRFLAEQPELPVWLLHAPNHQAMEAGLQRRGWPLGGHPVRDLGLTADTVSGARFVKRHLPGVEAHHVTPGVLPPALLLSALTASFVAGHAFGPLLSQAGFAAASSMALDLDSDFG